MLRSPRPKKNSGNVTPRISPAVSQAPPIRCRGLDTVRHLNTARPSQVLQAMPCLRVNVDPVAQSFSTRPRLALSLILNFSHFWSRGGAFDVGDQLSDFGGKFCQVKETSDVHNDDEQAIVIGWY